jgi:acyl carrier protein
MGLDIVELVMRCEEEFDVQLEDWRLGQMRTVGDLFEIVCMQLQLPFGEDAPPPKPSVGIPLVLAPAGGWTRDLVWSKLVAICVDQLALKPDEVQYMAKFQDDLGVD